MLDGERVGALNSLDLLGTERETLGHDVTVQGNGSIYVTGVTSSPDFPAVGALQPFLRGASDAFVVTMGPSGQLVQVDVLGGSACDSGWGVAVDASGSAYVTGQTNSGDFPVVAAAQPGLAVTACLRAMVCSAAMRSSPGSIRGVDADVRHVSRGQPGRDRQRHRGRPGGRAVVAGRTDSFDFPVRSAVQSYIYGGGPGGQPARG